LINDVHALAVSGTNLFTGTYGGGVYLSTNNGTSWTQVNSGLTNTDVFALTLSGTNLFAGTLGGGVYLSTDNGTSWTQVNSGITNTDVYALTVSGTNLFVGTWGGGVFLSTNNGTSWTQVNSGLTSMNVLGFTVSGKYLFAGTSRGGVWQRPLSEMTTSVEELSNKLPIDFDLSQNYPNPFNSSTTISFSIPSRSFVSLRVFDALGREVSNMAAEELPSGTYERQWNAEGLPSGIYFYRLQAGMFRETKKFVLLK
jgi:hypothetical protein